MNEKLIERQKKHSYVLSFWKSFPNLKYLDNLDFFLSNVDTVTIKGNFDSGYTEW